MKQYRLSKFFILVLVFLCFVITSFGYLVRLNQKIITFQKLNRELISDIEHFPGRAGLMIVDLKNNLTIRHNADLPFPSASLVKIPIMAACFQAINDGHLNSTDKFALKSYHKVGGHGRLRYYRTGKKFSIEKLLNLMIIDSDNTATNMLTEILGFEYLNQCFKKFGLNVTRLNRGIMDLKLRKAGIDNYTTAEEMAYLLKKIYKKELISGKTCNKMLEVLKRQKIRNRIPRLLPSGLEIANKTGTLRKVYHDAGIVFSPPGDFIICVLTDKIRNRRLASKLISKVAYKTFLTLSKL